ncbi:indolepyruvate ferredoxin oxidoreductase family protein [Hyphomonas sp.]|uniref:indolepyruvate ferredoxin oxidoreductase family protein n=1 Tax=Hyphomonas sp. TaxID=87 RepID=UPI003D271BFF
MTQIDTDYELKDRYERTEGRVFLTGIQALVKLPIMQRQLDRRNGLNTSGLISGYRGSPLGGYDQEIWRSKRHLTAHDVDFEPAINEDLGATILWGAQLVDYYREEATRDGVFTYWYGKAHGVDRSADVLRQANIQGTAKHGGVLAFVGDDHNAESSMFSHQTDQILESAIMPVLFPSTVEEFLTMGLAGMAMSRFSGLWCGLKTITETVESAASFDMPRLPEFVRPDIVVPPHGFNYDPNLNWPAERLEYERRMIEERVPAAHAFAYANKIDRVVFGAPRKRFGIVTTGKAHGDLMQALSMVGLSEDMLAEIGISIFKVGMSWPLEPKGIREFAEGMESLFVVEEKRPQLEKQIKEQLFNWPTEKRPEIVGKRDREGRVLLPEIWVFTPEIVSKALGRWLSGTSVEQQIAEAVSSLAVPSRNRSDKLVTRAPYFCSGCPHNTSTKVPDGSSAGAGIGCHIMVLGQGRRSETFTHMGGEGMHWVGLRRYSKNKHMFQNLGDGTYQHSGSLAIRQAVVSGTNITYKILFNDAVAMVGGQPVEGTPSPGVIAQQMFAEGVKRVALVSDDIDKYRGDKTVPGKTERHDRDDLDLVQRSMRETEGVTVIIYEQTCAAEKRRRRKKRILEDPPRRMFINDRVCEGCGDCSVQSNCISIEPKETEYGRKRQINQSSCNKDYSCVKGFCPSFVSVLGGENRKPDVSHIASLEAEHFEALPTPQLDVLDNEYSVLVAGIGGMGVLTIGGILSMAAHLEGKGATTLDFTGLSQKNGAVTAHVKIAPSPADINVPRISDGMADLLLGCDMIAAAPSIAKIGRGRTKSVINTEKVPVAAFTRNNDMYFPAKETLSEFVIAGREEDASFLDATEYAMKLFGDAIATNLFMVGYAYQCGFIPLHKEAIQRAIELNGVAVEFNKRAFQWGRVGAYDLSIIDELTKRQPISNEDQRTERSVSELIDHLVCELMGFQNQAYAERFRYVVENFQGHERFGGSVYGRLTRIVAKNLFKLMAYKDEYEVARLYSDPVFETSLAAQFEGDYKLKYHLAPPLISRMNKATGRPDKIAFGGWMKHGFRLLAKFKGLRGTAFDVFGYTHERREERQLIEEYIELVETLGPILSSDKTSSIRALLSLPDEVRGYGSVKEANIAKMRERKAALLAELHTPVAEVA